MYTQFQLKADKTHSIYLRLLSGFCSYYVVCPTHITFKSESLFRSFFFQFLITRRRSLWAKHSTRRFTSRYDGIVGLALTVWSIENVGGKFAKAKNKQAACVPHLCMLFAFTMFTKKKIHSGSPQSWIILTACYICIFLLPTNGKHVYVISTSIINDLIW